MQQILFDCLFNSLKSNRPTQSEEGLFKQTSLLIAPVRFFNGTPNTPGHSTGGAVDLEIIDSEGNLINFGMAIKDWNKVDPEICKTFSQKISKEAIKNREILLEVMYEQEFVNYPHEWWHFSYGDQLWAHLMNKKEAFYGGISFL